MIKTNNDENEAVTKGWFREAMREAIGEFAMIVNKSFVGVESRMGEGWRNEWEAWNRV